MSCECNRRIHSEKWPLPYYKLLKISEPPIQLLGGYMHFVNAPGQPEHLTIAFRKEFPQALEYNNLLICTLNKRSLHFLPVLRFTS